METNYEVKPKKSLRPLKAGLLVLAMVCFVLGTFAQQGQAVKVANNQQLLQALENPSTQTLVFGSGFEGVSAMKSPQALNAIRSAGDGGRSISCFYYIAESDVCWFVDTIVDGVGYRHNRAIAGSIDPFGCNCCPINIGDDLGTWSWRNTPGSGYDNPPPPGGNLIYLDPITKDTMDFIVSKPGIYTLRYTWGAPWFSFVQTEYRFYDQFDLTVSAPDTCGLCTEVHMEISSYFRSGRDTIEYALYNPCTQTTLPVTGPALDTLSYLNGFLDPKSLGELEPDGIGDDDTLQVEDFTVCVPDWGYWQFCVYIHAKQGFPQICDPVEQCIWIDFSKEPVADAGPDAEICEDLCYQLEGSTGIWNECYISPTYIHKWTKVSGPGLISITDPYSLTTDICRDEQTCSYGQYVIALEVTNGQCYDSDTTVITFYQQPTANAGDDQYICADLCFSLYAMDFSYCSPPIADERYNYWEFLSGPGNVNFDPELSQPNVCVTGECPYGTYTFVYHEINGTCFDTDTVNVTLFQQPEPYAGPDAMLCNDFAFSLYGQIDQPCAENNIVTIEWSLLDQPDNCLVNIVEPDNITPSVYVGECGICPFGNYTFQLAQFNGYFDVTGQFEMVCTGYDTVTVCISQQPEANAGEDFSMCYYGGCFTLAAMPFSYCNDEICGQRYGKWSKIGGPAAVEFTDENAPNSQACPDETSSCVYGVYTFVWAEYNGECSDVDTVAVTLYQPPTADAGDDAEYCVEREFSMDLWHTFAALPFSYCQENGFEAPYGYWSKSCGPGYVTFFEENNPNGWVHVTAFGCYCFVWHEVNGDCEDTDTVSVCFYEHPHLEGELHDSACIAELPACYDLGLLGLVPYEYLPDPNVNYNVMGWSQIGGSGNATFTDPSDPNTEVCVDNYGCYTFAFIQYNGMEECADTAYAYLTYFESPTANAGEDQEICGNCLYMSALPYSYVVNDCAPAANQTAYWNWFSYIPPTNPCGNYTEHYPCGTPELIEQAVRDAEIVNNVGSAPIGPIVTDFVSPTSSVTNNGGAPSGNRVSTICPDGSFFSQTASIDNPTVLVTSDVSPNYKVFQRVSNLTDQVGGITFWGTPLSCCWAPCTEAYPVTFLVEFWQDGATPGANIASYMVTATATYVGDVSWGPYPMYQYSVEFPNVSLGTGWISIQKQHTSDPDCWFLWTCAEQMYDATLQWDGANYSDINQFYGVSMSICLKVANPIFNPNAQLCVCDDYCGSHYGQYGFEWIEINGTCEARDTVWFDFKKQPDPLPLRGCFNPANSCNDYGPGCFPYGELYPGFNPYECGSCQFNCLYPEDTIFTVCAESCMNFSIDWNCVPYGQCGPGPIPGWTYEWSFIGPAGSYFNADPLWYDCGANCWKGSDQVNVCFGECCDTARLYLTITTNQGCVTTEEWKIVVQHRPDATISGPAVAEIGTPTEYTIPDPQNPCYLYIWEVQQCGVIASGQGTGQITVDWTNYTANNGWGLVYVEVHDTCTGCCNVDSLWVKVYPAGTLGDATLSGHVYYHNNIQTPLNGVELTLWNSGVAVATTTSFNDIEGGNGVGYYEFTGINGVTNFGITANYTAPWYGANATDALAVELKVINNLPGSFLYDDVVAEAMDVNNSNSITATDALWIKQRAINMVSYFPAGNWVYAPGMASTAGTYDIFTLNAGDANRSNIPASMKETPAINLITDGTMNVKTGQEYTLPIRIEKANQFGAMTLNLGYNPALLDVVEVNSIDGMLTNIADGNISIAWSSINPMVLADNDVVVTLKVKALGVTSASDQLFTVGLGSEFADPSANVIEPVTLKTYGISTEPAATDYFMSANRPNPFNTYTFIEYTLPETGKVKLSVLDMLGQELAVLVEATQTAGSYSVKFENPGLATGVYIYKITVDGETRDYISSQRMVISH